MGCPRSVAICSRRLASSPSTLTTIVSLPPEPASTTCTCRGSMAFKSWSKSPRCGSESFQGSFFISTIKDLTLTGSRLPSRDDQPGGRVFSSLDNERQRPPPVGSPDDEATRPRCLPARVSDNRVAIIDELPRLLDRDRSSSELLHRDLSGQQFMDYVHDVYLCSCRSTRPRVLTSAAQRQGASNGHTRPGGSPKKRVSRWLTISSRSGPSSGA